MILTPFKTIEKEDSFSGLGISNIWSIKKKAQKDLAEQIDKNAGILKKYQEGLIKLGDVTKNTDGYTKLWNSTVGKESKELQDVAIKIKNNEMTAQSYAASQRNVAAATKSVGIAHKVAAVGVGLLKSAMNVALITAISYGIQKVVEYVSNIKSASEQAKEELDTANKDLIDVSTKIDGINSKIKDTNDKINALKSKGTLTFVEKSQLTTLEKTSLELQTQLEIQQALQKLNTEKQTKAAIKSIDAQNDEKINPFTGNVNTDNNINAKSGIEGINQSLAFYSHRIKQVNKNQKEYNELLSKGNSLTEEEKRKKETLAYILKDDDGSTTLKENLLNRAKAYQEEADAIDVNSVSNKEAAQVRKQSALEQANAILKVVDAEQYAKNETIKFNSVWNNDIFSHVKNDLSNLAKQGKLTTNTLDNSKYSEFRTALLNVGISAEDVVEQINSLTKATNTNNNSVNKTTQSYDELSKKLVGLFESNISNYQSIDEILNNVKEFGTLSSNDLSTILSKFHDLSPAVNEYMIGLKSTSDIVSLLKQKQKSLSDSYKQELTNQLADDSEFYSQKMAHETSLTDELKNVYGIDYKNYASFNELKSVIDSTILSERLNSEDLTGQDLAQKYYANVKDYSQFEKAKTNITNEINQAIQGMASAQKAKLAIMYGIDVKDFAKIQNGKVVAAGEIATKIAQIYGKTNDVFAGTIKSQIEILEQNLRSYTPWEYPEVHKKLSGELNNLRKLAKAMSGDTSDIETKIRTIMNGVKTSLPKTSNQLKNVGNQAKDRAKSAESAAKKAEDTLKKQYETELKLIETNKSLGKYDKDRMSYYNALSALQNKWAKSKLD